jgi:hypothetical protein
MAQSMRNYYGLGFAEAARPEALRNLTLTGRPKCYVHKRNSDQAFIRLKEVRIDIARRQVAQIGVMIADLDCMVATLENAIEAEQNRTGIRDLAHFAYSILAKATIVRRDNLKRTVTGLQRPANCGHGQSRRGAARLARIRTGHAIFPALHLVAVAAFSCGSATRVIGERGDACQKSADHTAITATVAAAPRRRTCTRDAIRKFAASKIRGTETMEYPAGISRSVRFGRTRYGRFRGKLPPPLTW